MPASPDRTLCTAFIIFVTAVVLSVIYLFADPTRSNSLARGEPLVYIPQDPALAETETSTVACLIFTTPGEWNTSARAVRDTWARRCTIPIFFYSNSATSIDHPMRKEPDTVGLDIPEGRNHLTGKTMAALDYMMRAYGDEADWFFKADDDTYVIWENLQFLLTEHNSSEPAYIGHVFEKVLPHGYTSGGAGYLLSKPTVSMILNSSLEVCPRDGATEDVDIARCLHQLGVYATKAVGPDGKFRMHPGDPIRLLDGNKENLIHYHWEMHSMRAGLKKPEKLDDVMSYDTVSLHYITPGEMYMLDFLLYKLHRHQLRSPGRRPTNVLQRAN